MHLHQSLYLSFPELVVVVAMGDFIIESCSQSYQQNKDDYDMVYLYFPNDVMGCTITKTLKDRYGKHAIECNPLYKGYNNLLQFVKAIEITTNSK